MLKKLLSHNVSKLIFLTSFIFGLCQASSTTAAGVWTAQKHGAPGPLGTMLLLTDGSVIAAEPLGRNWYKLTPDSTGSYVNGTWSTIAPMSYSRLYFASAVMQDGRVFVGGGEYGNGGSNIEIYDPLKNTWTKLTSWHGGTISDSAAIMLPNGHVYLEPLGQDIAYIWNPTSDTWTKTTTKYFSDSYSEESSLLLPGGMVLNVVNSGVDADHAEIYDMFTNGWINAGNTGVKLVGAGEEIGPGVLLYNGEVVYFGAPGNTAIYNTSTRTWKAGPNTPLAANKSPIKFDDVPGAVMPNGKVLLMGDSGGFASPTYTLEFDPGTVRYSIVSNPPDPFFESGGAYVGRLLVLPTGQIMFSDGFQNIAYVYTPSGTPISSAAPKVHSVSRNSDKTYTLTGTQLNGLTGGAYYGDDAQMATNYAIIRLKSTSGRVYYGRSFDFSTMGVATGSASVSTKFVLPSGAPAGIYSLEVIANGIASTPFSVWLYPSQ